MSFADLVRGADRAAQTHLGGEVVTYTPDGGPPVPVTGIFDEEFVMAKGTADAGVEALGPVLFVRLEDLPEDPEDGDPTITINGVDYRIVGRIFAGMGGIGLPLRRVT